MSKETQLDRAPEPQHGTRDEEWVTCAACGHALTPRQARIEVEVRHAHTYVNPAGDEFTIGCFASASGATGVGEESTFWTWFRGFAWRIAACGGCGAHVGWSFRREASVFWGLILDRVKS